MRSLLVDGFEISDSSDCYLIAEIGHNHQGSVEQCKKLFDAAKLAGAHAVKLQKRDNRRLYTREMYDSPYNSENAYGPTYGTHREALEFGRDEYLELTAHARQLSITFFATAFDLPSADFLAALDMPAYKIASGDIANTPLIRKVAGYGRPVFISTGGASFEQVRLAYETARAVNPQICILQCTSGYPPTFEELNLRVIQTYREAFQDIVIGLSAHDSGIAMGLAGYVLGARVIEKHFTLNRALKGTDHAFSLEPTGLQKLARDLRRARLALGDGVKQRYTSEEAPLLKMGKKIVAARELPAGHVLQEADLDYRSPGNGLPPSAWPQLVGRRVKAGLAQEQDIRLEDLE